MSYSRSRRDNKKIPTLLIISSHQVRCGIASYTEGLSKILQTYFKVEIAALDQLLLRSRLPHMRKAGDEHIAAICRRIPHYDAINIQFEYGLFGVDERDIIKRLSMIVEACVETQKPTIITLHTILKKWKEPNRFKSTISFIKKPVRGIRRMKDRRSSGNVAHYVYNLLRTSCGKAPIRVVVHTRQDKDFIEKVAQIPNVYDHPLVYVWPEWMSTIDHDSCALREKWQLLYGAGPFIGFFGFINERKGIDVAIDAVKLLPDNYRLLIFGSVHPAECGVGIKINPHLETLTKQIISHVEQRKVAHASSKKQDSATEKTPLNNKIIFMGSPSDSDFAIAMNSVDVCVFPYVETDQSASAPASLAIQLRKKIITSQTRTFEQLSEYFPKFIEFFDVGNSIHLAQAIERMIVQEGFADYTLAFNPTTIAKFYRDLLMSDDVPQTLIVGSPLHH